MKKVEMLESVFLILAIVSLWPLIFLKWNSVWYYVYLYLLVAFLLFMSYRKFRRLQEAMKEIRKPNAGAGNGDKDDG